MVVVVVVAHGVTCWLADQGRVTRAALKGRFRHHTTQLLTCMQRGLHTFDASLYCKRARAPERAHAHTHACTRAHTRPSPHRACRQWRAAWRWTAGAGLAEVLSPHCRASMKPRPSGPLRRCRSSCGIRSGPAPSHDMPL